MIPKNLIVTLCPRGTSDNICYVYYEINII